MVVYDLSVSQAQKVALNQLRKQYRGDMLVRLLAVVKPQAQLHSQLRSRSQSEFLALALALSLTWVRAQAQLTRDTALSSHASETCHH